MNPIPMLILWGVQCWTVQNVSVPCSLSPAQGCGVVCEGAVGPASVLHKISYTLKPALFPLVLNENLLPMPAEQEGGMAADGTHTCMFVGAQHPGVAG